MLCAAPASAAPWPTIIGTDAPLLIAKSWLIGQSIVGLCILLGMLAVLIPSMRKVVRKKTS